MQEVFSFNEIFDQVIVDYHLQDDVDQPCVNSMEPGTLDYLLYSKCWIDSVQWHLEDIIRNPSIDPAKALQIKRRIDASNQDRTDLVEKIDDFFLERYENIIPNKEAKINTESPAWAIDRLSILALKLYHMEEQIRRNDVEEDHVGKVRQKLTVLWEQRKDLTQAISELLEDIQAGRRIMKVYRQMKMYNDPSLNPVLYGEVK
ncbi:MAG TPA: DUF4254 domain-containing protein [Cyclobacteriaceae bacterium]|nr:DUF4254 domain-containing protein [Cyclobacteriaceae bacterium]